MNWGTKIAIFYIFFMVAMLSMVFMSTKNKFSLVTDQYYETALDYDNHISQVKASQELENPLEITLDADLNEINLQFPDIQDIKGEIHLYRPSSHFMDKYFEIALNEGNSQVIPTGKLKAGLWKIKIKWESGEASFFDEKTLFLQ